jgi:hypothetical protein
MPYKYNPFTGTQDYYSTTSVDNNIRANVSALLSPGTHKILFTTPFATSNYALPQPKGIDISGNPVNVAVTIKEADGFTVVLDDACYVDYIAAIE